MGCRADHASQSRLIVQLNDLTFFRLILTLASCADKTEFNQYNVIVLDILYLTFGSIKPRLLAVDQKRVRGLTTYLNFEVDSS